MKHIKPINEYRESDHVDEKMKLIMRDILNKMVPAAFGPSSNVKMRDELRDAVKQAIEPILKKYDYLIEGEETNTLADLNENIVQNDKGLDFDGSDPSSIMVFNRGIGGVNSLQGHRDQIVRLLEKMLADAKMAQKNHKLAYYSIAQILSLADDSRMTGVFLAYLKNHQIAIEELEEIRRKGGSGAGKSIPKGLI